MFIRFLHALFSTRDRATGDLPAVQDFQLDRSSENGMKSPGCPTGSKRE